MKFTLNGDEVEANRITYEEVSGLAGYTSDVTPTVTYRNAGYTGDQEGTLSPGQHVIVNEETVMNCMDTGNA